jgi:hypothetical protein
MNSEKPILDSDPSWRGRMCPIDLSDKTTGVSEFEDRVTSLYAVMLRYRTAAAAVPSTTSDNGDHSFLPILFHHLIKYIIVLTLDVVHTLVRGIHKDYW